MRGGFRNVLRVAIQEALSGNPRRSERGWKLLLMLPRMLLFKNLRKGTVAKEKLMERSRRAGCPKTAQRADRALHLVQLGEFSSARQALEGAEIAPGDRNTLAAFQDPVLRPIPT